MVANIAILSFYSLSLYIYIYVKAVVASKAVGDDGGANLLFVDVVDRRKVPVFSSF
jgi:hypothetical protein